MTNNFSKNLKILRKLANQNQAEVAEIVKKGHTTVGNWEAGNSEPNIDELLLLAGHFKVTLNDLVVADMNPEPDRVVNDPGAVYQRKCPYCEMKDEVINALKGEIGALKKVVTHAEARLEMTEKPKKRN